MLGTYAPDITTWFLFFLIIGVINLPLTYAILPSLADRGWIFSKISALLFVSYAAWLLGTTKLLPFSNISLTFLVLVLLFINIFINRRSKKSWLKDLPLKIVIFEELLFLLAFAFWLLIRSHNPDIHDLEKFMDFGFINSILRSHFFPPKDIWLSGGIINYYYFGHLMAASVIKILGTRPEVGYNLTLSLLFALTLSGSFSLGINIAKHLPNQRRWLPIICGLLTAVFLTLFGNLQVILGLLKGLGSYWYPDATRFIPNTIHEFPIYSFVVADLHGHLFDIPTVLLMLIFLYANFGAHGKIPGGQARHWLVKLFFPGFLLSLMYMTNAADTLVYAGLLGLAILFTEFLFLKITISHIKSLSSFAKTLLTNAAAAYLFSLPFQLTFKPFAEGVKLSPERSPLWMFLILWGVPLFFALSFFAGYISKRSGKSRADDFILLLTVMAVFLILLPEVIYFKDIYTSQPRANTMFKLTYQAFILFAIISSYTISKVLGEILFKPSFKGFLWLLVSLNIMEILAVYPYMAITSAYGKSLFKNSRGLDGMKYLEMARPGDYATIKWINDNIEGQPVILEAVGESYTDYSRISANTGLPTVLGWPVHEWLWRKDVEITNTRRDDVAAIYSTNNFQDVRRILKSYEVEYIYIGQLEREKYPSLDEKQLLSLGQTVYNNSYSKLIRVYPSK